MKNLEMQKKEEEVSTPAEDVEEVSVWGGGQSVWYVQYF